MHFLHMGLFKPAGALAKLLTLAALIFLNFSALADGSNRIAVGSDEAVLVGYGSLINRESMQRSLGREYRGQIVAIRVRGYSRRYSVAMPNDGAFYYVDERAQRVFPRRIAYLNIEPDPRSYINAVAFVVKKSDLANFDRRERIYNRVTVSPSLIEGALFDGGEVYTYSGKPEYSIREIDNETVVRSTYVATVIAALAAIRSAQFFEEFQQTTAQYAFPVISDQKVEGADPFGYTAVAQGWGEPGPCVRAVTYGIPGSPGY